MQALGKTLPYDQPLRKEGVAKVTLQGLTGRHGRKVKTGEAINHQKANKKKIFCHNHSRKLEPKNLNYKVENNNKTVCTKGFDKIQ